MSHIPGEYYHIYNRGAHKAPIFHDHSDYWRFLQLMYVSNDARAARSTRRVDLRRIQPRNLFNYPRDTLTDIHAYCLMPNHFHMAVREKGAGGASKFIQKLCTSYAMYFNKKYDHSGTIFQGQYRSKHVDSDEYLRYLIQYIHLNPYGIEEPDTSRAAKAENIDKALAVSKTYDFSSYKDHLGEKRIQSSVLCATRAARAG